MTALLVCIGLGALSAGGIYLMLRPRTFDVILGLTLLSYAVNLFIFFMGRLRVGAAPIVDGQRSATLAHYADPLPQALVLTAIVISFAMTAVLLVIALRASAEAGSDHVDGVDHTAGEDGVGGIGTAGVDTDASQHHPADASSADPHWPNPATGPRPQP
jgi:multicomponent K+:H+ antiporter subunit C